MKQRNFGKLLQIATFCTILCTSIGMFFSGEINNTKLSNSEISEHINHPIDSSERVYISLLILLAILLHMPIFNEPSTSKTTVLLPVFPILLTSCFSNIRSIRYEFDEFLAQKEVMMVGEPQQFYVSGSSPKGGAAVQFSVDYPDLAYIKSPFSLVAVRQGTIIVTVNFVAAPDIFKTLQIQIIDPNL